MNVTGLFLLSRDVFGSLFGTKNDLRKEWMTDDRHTAMTHTATNLKTGAMLKSLEVQCTLTGDQWQCHVNAVSYM